VVLGCNGWVWVGAPPPAALKGEDLDEEEEERVRQEAAMAIVSKAMREKICRVAHMNPAPWRTMGSRRACFHPASVQP